MACVGMDTEGYDCARREVRLSGDSLEMSELICVK